MSFLSLGTPNSAAAGIVSSGFDTGYETTARSIAAQKKADADAASEAASQSASAAAHKATIDAENKRNADTLQNERLLKAGGLLETSLAGDEQKFSNIATHPEVYGAEGVAQAQRALQSISANRTAIGAQIGAGQQPQLTDPTYTGIGAVGISPSPQFLDTQALKPVAEKLKIAQGQSAIKKSAQELEIGDQKIGGNYLPNRNYRDPKTGKLTRSGFLSTAGASGTTEYADIPKDLRDLRSHYYNYANASGKGAENTQRTAIAGIGKTYPSVITGLLNNAPGYADYNGSTGGADSPLTALMQGAHALGLDATDLQNPANRDDLMSISGGFLQYNQAHKDDPNIRDQYLAHKRLYEILGGDVAPTQIFGGDQ